MQLKTNIARNSATPDQRLYENVADGINRAVDALSAAEAAVSSMGLSSYQTQRLLGMLRSAKSIVAVDVQTAVDEFDEHVVKLKTQAIGRRYSFRFEPLYAKICAHKNLARMAASRESSTQLIHTLQAMRG